MCTPTPISTVYSLSTSTIAETITTSSAVFSTPSPVISALVSSHCVSYATPDGNGSSNNNGQDSSGTSRAQTTVGPQTVQITSQREDENTWWTGRWGHRDRAASTTQSISTVSPSRTFEVNAFIKPDPTHSTVTDLPRAGSPTSSRGPFSSFQTESVLSSFMPTPLSSSTTTTTATLTTTSTVLRDTGDEQQQVSTPILFSEESGRRAKNEGPHVRPAFPEIDHRHALKRQAGQCVQWATTTLLSTSYPAAQTAWQTGVEVRTSYETVNVPVETVFRSCVATSTSERVVVAPISATTIAVQSATSAIVPTSSRFVGNVKVQQHSVGPSSDTWMGGTISTSTEPVAVAPAMSSAVASSSGDTPSTTRSISTIPSSAQSSAVSSAYKPLANANEPKSSSTSSSKSAVPTHAENENANESSGTPKSVSAGAAVGGILGLLLLLACLLFFVRWYLSAKRRNRIQGFSSVYFWRRPPQEEKEVVHRASTHYTASERYPSMLQSRFSAPSLMSRQSARLSRAVPAFLALPISHMRTGSGRFPNVFHDIRKSFSGTKEDKGVPAWAEKYDFPPDPPSSQHFGQTQHPLQRVETTLPPVPPLPVRTARDANTGDPRVISTRSPSPYAPQGLPATFATTPAEPPRLNMPEIGGSQLDWGRYSPPVSAEILHSPEQGDWQSTRSSSNIHGDSHAPLESYYSVYSTPSYYPGPHDGLDGIGQAVSAPGRESIEVSGFPMPPGSKRYPAPGITVRPPSAARNLVPQPMAVPDNLALPIAPHLGRMGDRISASGNSSIFEYSDYDPRHSSNRLSHQTSHTATTRATHNWYDKPLWDNQPDSVYGGMSGVSRSNTQATARTGVTRAVSGVSGVSEASGVWTMGEEADTYGRKSRSKSVRWGDEAPLPKPFDLARAL